MSAQRRRRAEKLDRRHHQAHDKDRHQCGTPNGRPTNWPGRPDSPDMINGTQLTSKNRNCDRSERAGCATKPSLASSSCDQAGLLRARMLLGALAVLLLGLGAGLSSQQSIIVDHHHRIKHFMNISDQQPRLAHNFQPASLLLAQNRSINFTHIAVDELTGNIYLGATNWLLQVSGRDLRVEQALRTGPTTSDSSLARDCPPAECQKQLAQVDLDQIVPRLLAHSHGVADLSGSGSGAWHSTGGRRPFSGATMHTSNASSAGYALLQAHRRPAAASSQPALATSTPATTPVANGQQQQQQPAPLQHNNYNKILAIDYESRHLIVCGSLNQGACRRHQLGNLANFSELIPLPVASDDEHSSTLALVAGRGQGQEPAARASAGPQQAGSVFYVAATNSRLGAPNRELVPAISARSLDWSSRDRAMQIIEHSFTDQARVDISFGLRDYYLVNYVHAFQHNNFVYFATVQRKSALLQLEEWGYVTRLARLCLNDLSFQSYAEMTLECSAATSGPAGGDPQAAARHQSQARQTNYNLLQDAHLMFAGRQLQQQLGLSSGGGGKAGGAVLVGAFSQSRDHTTRSSSRSAICLFPMDRIEAKFQENIDLCYNGTIKSRNMDYIAGSMNDCPKQQGQSRPSSAQSYCNEPVKLNGSIALTAEPVQTSDTELISSITSTLAPTSPVNMHWPAQTNSQSGAKQQQQQTNSIRQHQVLIAGTSDGQLKRFVLVASGSRLSALEFDSVSLVPEPAGSEPSANGSTASPVLADLHLLPAYNPQLGSDSGLQEQAGSRQQFVIAATAHKLVKLRVNACKATRPQQSTINGRLQSAASSGNNSSIVDDCLACSQLQDPFCGWCSNLGSCTTRDECISSSVGMAEASAQQQQQQQTAIHWTPFDSIRCSNYQPISPKNVPVQADASSTLVDVNVRLNLKHRAASSQVNHQLAAKLSQAQFFCHFDYLSLWNRTDSTAGPARLSGATTKATQARLNLHAGTVAIGCPLPVSSQRPSLRQQTSREQDHARVRLSVRLGSVGAGRAQQSQDQEDELQADRVTLEQVLGMRSAGHASASQQELQHHLQAADSIERELTLYDCSLNSNCRSCLSSGSNGRRWSCAWCPLSNKCTFNASHSDFGCAASAVASTTPHSALLPDPGLGQIRGSHLTLSLDRAQSSMLGLAIDRLDRCPKSSAGELDFGAASAAVSEDLASRPVSPADELTAGGVPAKVAPLGSASEILVPNNVRRSVQVALARPIHHYQPREKRVLKLECLVELEGAKARFSARLLDNTNVVCQESLYSFQAEIATQRAQLSVILNDNQVIETTEVILYKCHLFGVNPPAIASSVVAASSEAGPLASEARGSAHLHSSASWSSNLNDLFSLIPASGLLGQPARRQSDCSLCLNIDRKYQCAWCSNQCRHSDQCQELPASTCPPPRIDSIHPTSGPLEGGTLLTIEGSNLGSSEREIQEKIRVGGELCQLVMYSVSTRIVCKTGPSLLGPQAATVFVGNRAGVTSAHEKFLYKAVHLADVNPRVGPVSGGTRLILSGSNLNVGSRVQIYLDDIPCPLDSTFEMTSNQIACLTGPNLFVSSSMRIKQLTLLLDNSTHQLPFPFTYQPDPIITSIEPAESFLSGGRVILINGQHLASPQSIKLLVYLEHRPSVTNATFCQHENDMLITCLTPAFSRADLLEAGQPSESADGSDLQQQGLSYDSPGVKLKMALLMDDVRSVRNLDEYYHHLPHYITYFEDPQLFRLAQQVVEYREELVIAGANLRMKQLDQDTRIFIGVHTCAVKSIESDRVVVVPPATIAPVYEFVEQGRRRVLVERPLLPIVALVGANLRFDLGHMQYSSSQYSSAPLEPDLNGFPQDLLSDPVAAGMPSTGGQFYPGAPLAGLHDFQAQQPQQQGGNSAGFVALVILSLLGFLVAVSLMLMFALARFRQTKAKQREYKRIQLQMGSLDVNQSAAGMGGGRSVFASGLFDKIHLPSMGLNSDQAAANQQQRLFANQHLQHRPMDYATKGKPLYQFFSGAHQNQPPLPTSFPPSPLTDISSLVGSSPNHPQQHVLKLNSNGQVVSSTTASQHQYAYAGNLLKTPQQQRPNYSNQAPQAGSASSSSSSGSSSGSTSRQAAASQQQQQQQQHLYEGVTQQPQLGGQRGSSARNFNWTQEAPTTIVPYAVIEACNLTLEGKNAIKEFL